MNLIAAAGRLAERAPLPDALMRAGIELLVGRTRRQLEVGDNAEVEARFAANMARCRIAECADSANAQHYELPAEFFALVLGPQRKYSSCYYAAGDSLADAEERALAETAAHADLADGQRILELGCGWGSLSLYLAERYSSARITAVSNSHSQCCYIEQAARAAKLTNLHLRTADMNAFAPSGQFDRVVSVEMFEHMANWPTLLGRIRGWLAPEGKLFLHVFGHRTAPYRFDHGDGADWIAQYFFTGGIMPSHGLIRHFGSLFEVEREWRWSGDHYRRTALDWLANYDRNIDAIKPILRMLYGDHAGLWQRRWRLFFLATAGLFGHDGGAEWGVSHYRLLPV
ncbi:MAG TPA: cyclopropane-fatty-acyl-phospholipid synthase family protein [Stellaceae bacterium]|nr:cyclopropane-fatty-acyl-phospholipid synthase family protein [Stellaceae bacterium]